MTMMSLITPALDVVQAATSAYSLLLSSQASKRLDSYNSMSQKISKVDPTGTVEQEIKRTTQTCGLAVLTSIFGLGSMAYILYRRDSMTAPIALFNTFLNCLALSAVRNWLNPSSKERTKSKGRGKDVAGVGEYMQAWQQMEKLRWVVVVSGGLWTLRTMLLSAL